MKCQNSKLNNRTTMIQYNTVTIIWYNYYLFIYAHPVTLFCIYSTRNKYFWTNTLIKIFCLELKKLELTCGLFWYLKNQTIYFGNDYRVICYYFVDLWYPQYYHLGRFNLSLQKNNETIVLHQIYINNPTIIFTEFLKTNVSLNAAFNKNNWIKQIKFTNSDRGTSYKIHNLNNWIVLTIVCE